MHLLKSYVTLLLLMCAASLVRAVTPPAYLREPLLPAPPGPGGEMEDLEIRTMVDAGKVDCFYQEARKSHVLEVSYQVIEMSSRFSWLTGGAGDLTIDFAFFTPKGQVVVRDEGKSEGSHVHSVEEDGAFTLCFDNRRSRVGTKLVNIDVYLYSADDDDRWGQYAAAYTFSPETQYQESLETIRASLNKVRDALTKVVHAQEEHRAVERRDRNIVEQNFEYVNRFSLISIVAFVLVALTQLIFIRSFFDDKSVIRKYFKQFYN